MWQLELISPNHPPLIQHNSLPVDQYVTFDDQVLRRVGTRGETFRFDYPLPQQILPGIDLHVVCDLEVKNSEWRSQNDIKGSNFGFVVPTEGLGGEEEASRDKARQAEFRKIIARDAQKRATNTSNKEEMAMAVFTEMGNRTADDESELRLLSNRILARQLNASGKLLVVRNRNCSKGSLFF